MFYIKRKSHYSIKLFNTARKHHFMLYFDFSSITVLLHNFNNSALQLAQNAAARVIKRTPKREHMTPVLRDLHWLPINRRIDFKILLFVFKALHSEAPPYIYVIY